MKLRNLLFTAITASFFACETTPEEPSLQIPDSYTFERDNVSTVNYQGQTDRLNMTTEIKNYIASANSGTALSLEKLLNMYANSGSPFSSAELNASTKQLEDKTNPAEVNFIKTVLNEAASVSNQVAQNRTTASAGVAGLIERGTSGNFILVNEKGWEFKEIFEKGVMGAVFYHQIFNVYLSESKTGNGVENTLLEEGKNYTAMEHHWDEAFGYWGVPTDFPNGNPVLDDTHRRFWATYTHGRNELLQVNEPLMKAYITGRAAIVAKNYALRDAQKEIIIDLHELVAAATAIHYINSSMNSFSKGDTGSMLHTLSEAYGFVKALQYSPRKKISNQDINLILTQDMGENGDFWKVTMQGLTQAKTRLSNAYPELKSIQDVL